MKNPFDRIVGPGGEWVDPEAGGVTLTGREKFALRCLNAAANLYGVVSARDFCGLYNRYAAGKDAPVSRPMDADEMMDIAERVYKWRDPDEGGFAPCLLDDPDRDEVWFSTWRDGKGGEFFVVAEDLTSVDHPKGERPSDGEADRIISKRIKDVVSEFLDVPLKVLPEDKFLMYEDPLGDEETPKSIALAKFLKKEFFLKKTDAEIDVYDIQGDLRVNGATCENAFEFMRDTLELVPEDRESYFRLADCVGPVVQTTRTWDYRGHTAMELVEMGVLRGDDVEAIPDVFGVLGGKGVAPSHGLDDDDYYDEEKGEEVRVEDLPPAKLTGPFDFKSVKDPVVRDRLLWDYEGVRIATCDFVRHVVMHELTKEERIAAATRLGFEVDEKTGLVADANLDMVAGDFAAMMDDQNGEPAIKRVLKRKDKLEHELDRAAAEYYENYRYTWLEVLAVKAGLGVKCRDLLTDEELFLMEKSFSLGDVKGMTICAGIAPMGEVYLVLGLIGPANFENPATILKIVLSHLKLPTEIPVRLSFADQARFAAESIRRINANGKFGIIAYGATP